jgi:hypothetical protein
MSSADLLTFNKRPNIQAARKHSAISVRQREAMASEKIHQFSRQKYS